MKIKIITVAILGIFIYSCSPKVVAPIVEVKKIELTPELAAGKNIYENNCVGCHKLPKVNELSQEGWKPVLVRMQKKARLNDAQMVVISNYIFSQL
ncbi:cytochrome c [Flavobacterium psychrophilum]|uniref:c-type cytochrome n=1 Tax=Flavobacterium psychrophilum TaxID=96345 RepID=UPI000B7C1BB9|nr:cytochrome c [Flavobacterium psychrophilum]ELV7525479.1 cytochrome c [Flavobacterium psychrophilum]ELY1979930.1 cytochrome c [Flavobacterium psychrophilum]MBF1997843.1 cytochrome c [Flavobacterium psychrophilum]MBF2082448.1 cytochrome c [Flavobacterium psychrophilum]MCB6067958.1 cytochrome c [Flavobacterium psychrophilum]